MWWSGRQQSHRSVASQPRRSLLASALALSCVVLRSTTLGVPVVPEVRSRSAVSGAAGSALARSNDTCWAVVIVSGVGMATAPMAHTAWKVQTVAGLAGAGNMNTCPAQSPCCSSCCCRLETSAEKLSASHCCSAVSSLGPLTASPEHRGQVHWESQCDCRSSLVSVPHPPAASSLC